MKGVLLFAFNNELVDYVKLAHICGNLVNKRWDLPVCIVSDSPRPERLPKGFVFWKQVDAPATENKKNYYDYGTPLNFWNANRHLAYELTPFTQTILMDSDLLIQTDSLVNAWDGRGLRVSRSAYSVDGTPFGTDIKWLSQKSLLPMYWATIVCFDKSKVSEEFFGWWKKVVINYSTYAHIFGFSKNPFRNDFAVSVALEIMKGNSQSDFFDLPYSIPTLQPGSTLTSLDPMIAFVPSTHPDEFDIMPLVTDVHVMNKKSILECPTT